MTTITLVATLIIIAFAVGFACVLMTGLTLSEGRRLLRRRRSVATDVTCPLSGRHAHVRVRVDGSHYLRVVDCSERDVDFMPCTSPCLLGTDRETVAVSGAGI